MRFSMISFGALMLASAAPAMAQDTAPASEFTINGSATIVSDYRFRGVSQTDGNFAVQGGLTISHSSGFYISAWGSSIDDYVTVHGTAHQELDLIAGYKHSFGGATVDVGALYYVYPGTRLAGDTSSSDFIEPYASVSYGFGPVTAKATVNYAPKQKALALDQGLTGAFVKNDNVYLAGDFSASIPSTPIGLTAHIGHTFGPSWLATDFNGSKEYTDWGLGATVTWKALTFGVSYVDSDATFINALSGKKLSGSGVVGSVGVSF